MYTKQHENGLGTLAVILFLVVPAAMGLFYNWNSAWLTLFADLIIVGSSICAKGEY